MLTNLRFTLFFFAKLLIIVCGLVLSISGQASAQEKTTIDTLQTIGGMDTLRVTKNIPKDTLRTDSTKSDSAAKVSKSSMKSEVKYKANDSITFNLDEKKVLMFGTAQVNYEKTELKAAYITYGFSNNLVYAAPLPDSAGLPSGKPIFADNGQSYESDTLTYNFKTKKGAIKGVYTKMNNDGHIYGKLVKKDSNDVLWIKNGNFCPCEDKDALTRIRVGKIKVIPNSKIITNAGYLSIGKIPTPLVFPFGFFPNQQKQSSGILVPLFQESPALGFSLIGLGYYQPINDKVDIKLTSDLYSKGSFAIKGMSAYRANYKSQGNVSIDYNSIKNSYRELPDFTDSRNFFLRWNHSQDAKAKPNTSFNANVNVGTSSTFRSSINSNINDYLSNTFTSGVNYSKSWEGKPYNLSLSANHSQNTGNRSFSLTLPNAAFNVSRIYLPLGFLKSKTDARTRWFEKLGLNYSANFQNSLNTNESELRFNNLQRLSNNINNGLLHNASLSTSFKVFNFTINPNISYNDRWYFNTVEKFYDSETNAYGTLKKYGFDREGDYALSVAFTSQLFGMYTFKKGKVSAIRHLLTPSVSLNYRPAFDNRVLGQGENGTPVLYSPYESSLNNRGAVGLKSGGLNFSLANNLEMKVRTPKDTASATKKIKLIDRFSINSFYDVFKDSLNWSNIQLAAGTILFKNININYNSVYNPYNYDDLGNTVNESLLKARGKLLRMENTSLAIGANFGEIKPQIKENKKGQKWKVRDILPIGIPITANISYVVDIRKDYRLDTTTYTQSLSGSGTIQLLRTLRVGYNTGWDFTTKKLTNTFLNIYWDLNCWELSVDYTPFGFRKSYGIRLNMKSAILKDLKLERKRNIGTPGLLL